MNEYGTVIGTHDGKAVVRIKRHAACGDCKACALGVSNLSELDVDVDNSLGAEVGDHVRVEMQTPDVLKAAFLVYTIPLFALMTGIVSVYFITKRTGAPNEALMIAAGAVLMVLSGFFVRSRDKKIRETTDFTPKMTEVKKVLL